MKYDVIIVGAGIAGLTAAIYVRRAEKSVLVLEGKVPGGQIINTLTIENWPGDMGVSGAELMQKIQKQATELGAEIEMEEVTEITKLIPSFWMMCPTLTNMTNTPAAMKSPRPLRKI